MIVVSLTNTIYIAGQGILRALENKTGVSNEYEPFSIIKKYFSKIKPKFQIPEFLITATHGHRIGLCRTQVVESKFQSTSRYKIYPKIANHSKVIFTINISLGEVSAEIGDERCGMWMHDGWLLPFLVPFIISL